jgi:hypothetical protein
MTGMKIPTPMSRNSRELFVEAAACTVTCGAPLRVEKTACEQQAAGVDREDREHGCRVTVVASKAAGQRPEGACQA